MIVIIQQWVICYAFEQLPRSRFRDVLSVDEVLAGAGGDVVRFDDHTPLTYGKPIYENPFFIAYAPGVELKPA